MTVAPGTRLGPYEILAPLGAGGMGEVWRARDHRLGREVAVKLLPEAFASERERLARFHREAQVLASLNHPRIAAIYGVEESGGVEALVLELVDGETLAERIARGSLPLEEALDVARGIAEALEAAHERGIVHRDLKPSNVKLTPAGEVKVLDFGLAKALSADVPAPDVSRSPTITAAATQAGVVIGTAAYMSPEQARGRAVDKRADIWAFGAILWEMITGRRLFEGDTVSDVLASVLRQEIPFTELPRDLPIPVSRLLRRCLERDPKNRLHDIGDARLEIEDAGKAPPPIRLDEVGAPGAARAPRAAWLPWSLAAAAALAAVLLALRRPAAPAETMRLSVAMPENAALDSSGEQVQILTISPDGRRVAFRARHDGGIQIYVRDLALDAAEPVAGTANASDPVFSPDGQWLAFVSEDQLLKKTAIHGGSPMNLAGAPRSRGIAWGEDGSIVFAGSVNAPISRIPSGGGESRPITQLDRAGRERTHRWPDFVGRKWVLFTVGTEDKPGDYDDARIEAVSLETGKRHLVYRGASQARFLPPSNLLLARRGDILVAPFDAGEAKMIGVPNPVLQGVSGDARSGVSFFDVSKTGKLLLATGLMSEGATQFVWLDPAGHETPTGIPPGLYTSMALSRDGQKLAYGAGPGGGARSDVWIADLAHSGQFQLTSTGEAAYPCWSADGTTVFYTNPAGSAVMRQRADGTSAPETIWRIPQNLPIALDSVIPDGSALILTLSGLPSRSDILRLPLSGGGEARPLVATPGAEWGGTVSPDGRWIAYTGEYEGSRQVFVQPYPSLAGRWQISRNGGAFPRWSSDGAELFYLWNDQIYSVPLKLSPNFSSGAPRPVVRVERPAPFDTNYVYDVAPDGKRFLVLVREKSVEQTPRLDVIVDFPARLGAR